MLPPEPRDRSVGWSEPDLRAEPAPVGIADRGFDASGATSDLTTPSFVGSISLDTLAASNGSLGTDAAWVSFQMNLYVEFSVGGSAYVFWVQDVVEVNTSSGAVAFFDNVWNATSTPYSVVTGSSVSGRGNISSYGGESYYGYGAPCIVPGACSTLIYPTTVRLQMNASVAGSGAPEVSFLFDDGFGSQLYDAATFGFARPLVAAPQFVVDSSLAGPGCPRCAGDAELVAGGPDDGFNNTLSAAEVNLSLYDWTGHDYASVPAAYNFGISTGEGLNNATVSFVSAANGTPTAQISAGEGSLGALWGSASVTTVEVSVVTGSLGGSLEVNGTDLATFTGRSVTAVLVAGSYTLSVASGGQNYSLGLVELPAGAVITLEVGAPALVFEPQGLPHGTVWAVTVGGQELNGTGNVTFGETPGNYSFSVGGVGGYTPDPASGSIAVGANGTVVEIQWSAVPAGPWAGLVDFLLAHLVLIAVLSLALLLAAALVSTAQGRRRRARRSRGPPAGLSGAELAAAPAAASLAGPRRTCPHCGSLQTFAYGSCTQCGWRPPPPPARTA